MRKLTSWIVLVSIGAIGCAPDAGSPGTVVYEGARLIVGDETPPIEDGVFLVADESTRDELITGITERRQEWDDAGWRHAREPGRQDGHAHHDQRPRARRL